MDIVDVGPCKLRLDVNDKFGSLVFISVSPIHPKHSLFCSFSVTLDPIVGPVRR